MIYILFALTNGVLIAVARILNGRLASHQGAFYSSWINHFGGFVFLTALVFFSQGFSAPLLSIPWYIYFGGVIGGLYVGLNSFVVPHLGVTKSTLLVIAGQLVVSVLIDMFFGNISLDFNGPSLLLYVGCVLVLGGFYLFNQSPAR